MNTQEIERKFLTKTIPFGLDKFICKNITQLYISTSPTIRIRKSDNNYYLTVKSKGHISRQEFEIEITENEYIYLSTKADTLPLSKKRYLVPLDKNLTAEIDIYDGNLTGLITTEVEFSTIKDAKDFVPPIWMGEDITYDKRYKNTYLSKYGIPDK